MKKIFRNTVTTMTVMITILLSLSFAVKAIDNDHINSFNGEDYGDSEEHLEQMEEDLKAAGYECFTVGYSYNEEWSANEDFQHLSLCTGTKTRVYCIPSEVEAYINGGGNEAKLTLMHNTYMVDYFDFWSEENETATAVFQADISNAFKEAHPDAEITVKVSTGSGDKSFVLSAENGYTVEEQEYGDTFYLIQSVEISDGLRSEYSVDYSERIDFTLGETTNVVITVDGGAGNTSQPEESGDTAAASTEPSDTELSGTGRDAASSAASVEDVPTEESQSPVLFIVIAVAALVVIVAGVVIVKKKG